ncbi:MAG: hypothetical protein FJX33_04455 [Alphaproteobacteria bacterium]|nr:hypothetical protein [Alphaproteobacteria bacterium]
MPALLVSGLTLADHYRRSGHAVLSTSRQIVMVQALLSLVSRGVPVFEGETLIARTARETVVGIYYFSIAALNIRLFEVGHDGTGNRRGRIGQLCVGLASESG